MIHRIAETTSTNDDARDARYRHGDVVWAERQSAGRGQRGHAWSSAEGENLTFSLVLEPVRLAVGEQFLLSQAVALALVDTFAACGIDTRIKWTNDIYAGDRKLVGILIEHRYSGPTLARSVVGIGINVNQTAFDPALPNPVSMALAAGRRFDRRGGLDRPLGGGGRPPRSAATRRGCTATGRRCAKSTAGGCTASTPSTPSASPTARPSKRPSAARHPPERSCWNTATARATNIFTAKCSSC